jgi:hypothetical protein
MVAPDEGAVLDVYTRSSTVPAEYLTMEGCGVVAVWTKRALEKCRYMIRARVHSS